MITKYNLYNESLKDKMKGKSDIELINNIKHLSPQKQFEKACEYGILSIVQKLLENDIDPSTNNNHAIQITSEKGYDDIVKLLLKDKRVDPSSDNNYAIRYASNYGHLEVVKELLKDDRVDPSSKNNQSIRNASINGHIEIVKELLKDDRVDPSDYNNFAIKYASKNGHLEVIKLLLKDKRVDPSDENNYTIQVAEEGGYTEIVNILKQHLGLYESLRDKIKGKSKEEIESVINQILENIINEVLGRGFFDHLDVDDIDQMLDDEYREIIILSIHDGLSPNETEIELIRDFEEKDDSGYFEEEYEEYFK